MGKISLRAYNLEIESLLERGQTEEAIAHCKHILKSFPKHINTYRLLGKTYLESQRYSEAADIFQRVLSVVPDDFVAQGGMSIIREDEGNLDAAIWHMERAFEIQPSNSAVQSELRRLYGQRDGIEPPRVRLTRGALIRMYMRGGLYPQAIAEARAALAEDPRRIELEILLAKLYHASGKLPEATEVCGRIISRLPFCYEANRILAEILPSTAKAEEAKTYQQTVIALDPYAAFLSSATPTIEQVPENAVMLDRLDWKPGMAPAQQPDWARTIGVELQEAEETTADWMSFMPPEAQPGIVSGVSEIAQPPVPSESGPQIQVPTELPSQSETQTAPPSEEPIAQPTEELIPDWMKAAGWAPSEGQIPEMPGAPETSSAESGEEIAQAEIPDWLKSLSPFEEPGQEPLPEEEEQLAFLESILPPAEETHPGEPVAPEEQFQPSEPAATLPIAPSIEEQIVEEQPSAEQFSTEVPLPDWLKELETSSGETEQAGVEPEIGQLPDWLKETAAPAEEEAASKWLEDLVEEAEQPELETGQATPPPTQEWKPEEVSSAFEIAQEAPAPSAAPAEPEIDTAFAWLETLAARQGAEKDTLLTPEEERVETPPDWVQEQVQAPVTQEEQTPVTIEPTQPVPVQAAEEIEGTTAEVAQVEEAAVESAQVVEEEQQKVSVIGDMDMDAAMAWLESLAARQGADEETLITAPKDRSANPPEWIQKLTDSSEESLVEEELPVEPSSVEIIDETAIFEETQPETPVLTPPPSTEDLDSAFSWLEALAARQGADEETLINPPTERLSTPPSWVYEETVEEPVEEQPIAEVTAEEKAEEPIVQEITGEEIKEVPPPLVTEIEIAPAEEEVAQELPDWLKGIEEGSLEESTAPETEEKVPTWVQELEATAPVPPEESLSEWLQSLETAEETQQAPPISEPEAIIEIETAEVKPLEPSMPEGAIGEAWKTEPATAEEETLAEIQALEQAIAAEAAYPSPPAEQPSAVEQAPPEAIPVTEQLVVPAVESTGTPSRPEPTVAILEDSKAILAQARVELDSGKTDLALERYNQMIQAGELLEEVIHDLRNALYRFPVDISIWQSLGDAYASNNLLQEALDAYTKAEELLR